MRKYLPGLKELAQLKDVKLIVRSAWFPNPDYYVVMVGYSCKQLSDDDVVKIEGLFEERSVVFHRKSLFMMAPAFVEMCENKNKQTVEEMVNKLVHEFGDSENINSRAEKNPPSDSALAEPKQDFTTPKSYDTITDEELVLKLNLNSNAGKGDGLLTSFGGECDEDSDDDEAEHSEHDKDNEGEEEEDSEDEEDSEMDEEESSDDESFARNVSPSTLSSPLVAAQKTASQRVPSAAFKSTTPQRVPNAASKSTTPQRFPNTAAKTTSPQGTRKIKHKARKMPNWMQSASLTADRILAAHPVEKRITRKRCAMKSGCWYNKLTNKTCERDNLPWVCLICQKGFHESCYFAFHLANFPEA